jgi:hypothetical protein
VAQVEFGKMAYDKLGMVKYNDIYVENAVFASQKTIISPSGIGSLAK